jgi:iron complex outermembrane receptor protein
MHNLNQVYQLRLDYKLNTIDLTSISAYQYDNKYHPEDSDAGPLDTVRSTFGARSGTFTQEFRAAHNSDYYHWVVGAYYLHEDLYQNQPLSLFYNGDLYGGLGIPAGAGSFDNTAEMVSDKSHQTTDAPALYGQGDYTYQNFTLTLGGRVTYEKKSFSYDQFSQFQEGGLGNYG